MWCGVNKRSETLSKHAINIFESGPFGWSLIRSDDGRSWTGWDRECGDKAELLHQEINW
jgi:hypothetical protein